MVRKARYGRGFSLIETMVAIFVIGSTVALYVTTLRTSAVTREASHGGVALRIAEHKLEELRAAGYDALPASGTFSDSQLSSLTNSTAALTVTTFNPKTKQVVVTVSWSEPAGGDRSLSLATLITQVGGL